MATRNSTGWNTGRRQRAEMSGLRWQAINVLMLGAFALIAGSAISQVPGASLAMDVLVAVGIVVCLAGWRMLVVARRRERASAT